MQIDRILDQVVAKFIGTKHERDIKRIAPLVQAINALEPAMQQLTESQMKEKTAKRGDKELFMLN